MEINRLKTTYQRNMLLGNIVAGLIAFAVALIIVFSREQYVVIELKDSKYIESFTIPSGKPFEMISEKCSLGTQFEATLHDLDSHYFNNRQSQYSHLPFSFGNGSLHDFTISAGNYGRVEEGAGSRVNYKIGENEWPIAPPKSLIGEYSFDHYSSNRSISPPEKNRAMIIEFRKPLYPSGLRFKTDAVVTLGFHLTEKGTITQIDVIKEEPIGFGFALTVKEALRDSWIKPAVINGKKKGGYYILTYEFCEKCPSRPAVVESSPNVVVTIK